MSFNSKQYLAYEEARLEPEPVKGTHRRYKELRRRVVEVMKPFVRLTEEEDNKRQDEYLRKHGVI